MVIPYSTQSINQDDIDSVESTLRSSYLTQGPAVAQFEEAIADYCGARYAVATNSGTSALHIACLAIGVGEEDWIWTSSNSFVASANCARYCGAKVDFIDIDVETGNISIHALEEKCRNITEKKLLPKAVIAVDFAGQPCQLKALKALSVQYGFFIIEDASHALGAEYESCKVGSTQYADITVFSFHPVKIITSAEGGMAVTNDEDLAEQMRLLVSHAITRDEQKMTDCSEGGWYYQQIGLGFNYRLTDIQAALGLSQLKRINEFHERRVLFKKQYDDFFSEIDHEIVEPLTIERNTQSSHHLYVILIKNNKRKLWYDTLKAKGIFVNVHYIPIHTQPYYKQCFIRWKIPQPFLPNTLQYYQQALTIPLFPSMTDVQQNEVISSMKNIMLTQQ